MYNILSGGVILSGKGALILVYARVRMLIYPSLIVSAPFGA